jgi:hypothetical protein
VNSARDRAKKLAPGLNSDQINHLSRIISEIDYQKVRLDEMSGDEPGFHQKIAIVQGLKWAVDAIAGRADTDKDLQIATLKEELTRKEQSIVRLKARIRELEGISRPNESSAGAVQAPALR